jgi:CheY-like chemotaxis protein
MGNESESESDSSSTARILLVEDSDDLRTLMVLILESEGYWVDAVPTALEGLDRLNRCPYDLLLSDYALPGHTGAWLVRQALDRRLVGRDCAIIITAHPNPADTAGFLVIRKPLDFESFLTYVRELLD